MVDRQQGYAASGETQTVAAERMNGTRFARARHEREVSKQRTEKQASPREYRPR